jgi:hypothetical protein
MQTHSRHIWLPFAAVALLAIVGLFVLDGTAGALVLGVATLAFVAACIYALAGEKVHDGAGGIGGPFSW